MSEALVSLLVLPAFLGSGVALFVGPLAGARAAWLTLAVELGALGWLIATRLG